MKMRFAGRHWAFIVTMMTLAFPDSAIPATSVRDNGRTWLDDLSLPQTQSWVASRNAQTMAHFRSNPQFGAMYSAALDVQGRESADICGAAAFCEVLNDWVYSLRKDEHHPRGLWRRALLTDLENHHNNWETLIDVDELSRKDGVEYTFQNYTLCACARESAIIQLQTVSASGQQHFSYREYSFAKRGLRSDGFSLEGDNKAGQAAGSLMLVWKDENTLLVIGSWGADGHPEFGAGWTVREFRRDDTFATMRVLFQAEVGQRMYFAVRPEDLGGQQFVVTVGTVGTRENWLVTAGKSYQLAGIPVDAELMGKYKGNWIVALRETYRDATHIYPGGDVLAITDGASLSSSSLAMAEIFSLPARSYVRLLRISEEGILAWTSENGIGALRKATLDEGRWRSSKVEAIKRFNVTKLFALPGSRNSLVVTEDFTSPPRLFSFDFISNKITPLDSGAHELVEDRYITRRLEAESRDNYRVPYFVVRRKGQRSSSPAPTLLRGHGSISHEMTPEFDPELVRLWLDRGGVYVRAIVRGGTELGYDDRLHVTGVERIHTYEDFIAVAEDLIRRRITSAARLGILGHSNGGLLVGVVLNMRPDLFKAAVIQNGVLDQLDQIRGKARTQEFAAAGNAAEMEFLRKTSPLQNLRPNSRFPPPLVMTASDDYIPARWARRYVDKLESMGESYFYFETSEGGHDYGTTPQAVALHEALTYSYLAERLIDQRRPEHAAH